MVVGIICIAAASISIMATKKSANRDENKNWVVYILFAVGGLSLAGSVVGMVMSAATSANDNASGSGAAE